MSLFRRFDLLEPSVPSFLYKQASICSPTPSLLFPFDDLLLVEEHHKLGFGTSIDLLAPAPLDLSLQCGLPMPAIASPELYDGALDLLLIERSLALRSMRERVKTESCIRSLADRVAALELGFARAVGLPVEVEKRDRKYKWEAEVKGGRDGRKWKWIAEALADGERRVKWEVDVSGEGKETKSYSFETTSAVAGKGKEKEKKDKKEKGKKARIVEITGPETEPGAVVLRKAFSYSRRKGKGKVLSAQDAALIIQMNFRAHLIRRSQVLRELRSLAVAKAKLREIRALFSNFSYRRRIASDAEERQRFSEKIIVLLLTVDALEGPDYMIRAARKSMVDELEAMLEVIDPLPAGKLTSLKRRKFDLPGFSAFQGELAAGVDEVVQLINHGV